MELLKVKMQQEQRLLRERDKADDRVCRLMDDADAERATIERLRQQVTALEQRRAELRQAVELGGEGLADLLSEAHLRGLLEPALRELDIFEEVPDVAP
jgi:hypothetical protein